MSAEVRLYVDHPLGAGQSVPLHATPAHYLFGEMRLGVGDARQALLFSSSPQAIRAYRALGFQPNGGYSLVLIEGPQEVRP